jgi:rRNA pseudouridine-1189 N-methylase Emg1 (Nep1/Mra1 family)
MITFLLAEAEIEALSSPFLFEGREVRILDAAIMPTEGRRGRPDAALGFVRPVLASGAFRHGDLGLLVHTRDGRMMEFLPGAAFPEERGDYLALLTELYDRGSCCDGLVRMRSSLPLPEELRRFRHIVVMSPLGERKPLRQVAQEGIVVVVGGFTSGELSPEIFDQADEVISLGDEYLTLDLVAALLLEEITSRVPASSARA